MGQPKGEEKEGGRCRARVKASTKAVSKQGAGDGGELQGGIKGKRAACKPGIVMNDMSGISPQS